MIDASALAVSTTAAAATTEAPIRELESK